MEAYKFETTISKNGVIQLPEMPKFANRPIEVSIVVKQADEQSDTRNRQTMDHFLDKWTGFLKGTAPDDLKFQYLSEKYK